MFPTEHCTATVETVPTSRIYDIVDGKLAWTEVDLLDIGDSSASPLRNALEEFGIQVNLRPIGQSRHVLAALGGAFPIAPFVIVSCHGEDGQILLPELGGSIAEAQPFHGSMGPAQIRDHLRIPGSTVISTGCETGRAALAAAFLDAGANGYFAPADAPEGHSAFFAVLTLFYELTAGRELRDAVNRVKGYDDELSMWEYWTR